MPSYQEQENKNKTSILHSKNSQTSEGNQQIEITVLWYEML